MCDADGTIAAAAAAAVESVTAEGTLKDVGPAGLEAGVAPAAAPAAAARVAEGATAVATAAAPAPSAGPDPADVGIVKYLQIDTKLTPAKVLALKWRDAEVGEVVRGV